jgi:NADP-dependent 3-hydroxy acid dehydrogenase YdfG
MPQHFGPVPRISVVTGASQGIGAAIAGALADNGWTVYAVARRREALSQLADSRPEGLIVPAAADLTDDKDIADLVRLVAGAGPIGVLVHAAGRLGRGSVEDTEPRSLTEMLETNLIAPYTLTRAVLALIASGGSVVMLNSSQGVRATGGTAAYAASKHALKGLTDALRDELSERRIRVTSIFPGRTATPGQAQLYEAMSMPYRPDLLLQPESIAELVLAIVNLPPSAEVTEIYVRPALKSY